MLLYIKKKHMQFKNPKRHKWNSILCMRAYTHSTKMFESGIFMIFCLNCIGFLIIVRVDEVHLFKQDCLNTWSVSLVKTHI